MAQTSATLAAAASRMYGNRSRELAIKYKSSKNSAESIRAKVREEMREEQRKCKEKVAARLEQEEEEQNKINAERRAVRKEISQVLATELLESGALSGVADHNHSKPVVKLLQAGQRGQLTSRSTDTSATSALSKDMPALQKETVAEETYSEMVA